MKFHEISMVGSYFAEGLTSLPTWTINDKKRLIYVNGILYYGGETDWIQIASPTNNLELHIEDTYEDNVHGLDIIDKTSSDTTSNKVIANNDLKILEDHRTDTNNPHVVTTAQISAASETDLINHAGDQTIHVPTGAIFAFATDTVPEGYLECDGSTLSTITYNNLYNIIGTTFGSGSGTFNLPDLRGQFIRGWDNGRGLDPTSPRTFGSSQSESFKAHTHPVQTRSSNDDHASYRCPTGSSYNATPFDSPSHFEGARTTGGDETRPTNIALMYCIKY